MVSQKVVIKNPTGLHLRPAGILCKEAMQFKSLITFKFRENTANAKSVLSVLGACVKCGDEIEFVCEGVTQGIKDLNIQSDVPVIFCVLTDNNEQQSIDRSGGKHGNKGIEAAIAAIKMAELRRKAFAKNKIGF